MRYHHRLDGQVNVSALALALFRKPELWNQHRFRTSYPGTPHGEVDDIWLRFSAPEQCAAGAARVIEDAAPVWYPAAAALPEARPIILDLMRAVGAYELGRVVISRLRPGGRILPHADAVGAYTQDADRIRFHVVVQGLPGSLYTTGDETVTMRTGEVWAFDAREVHSVANNSVDDRIHLLVDVRTWPA